MVVNIHIATTKDECENIYRFRYSILDPYELNDQCIIDHEQGLIYDPWDTDATLIYAEKNNQIVGTVRVLESNCQHFPDFFQKTYQCENICKHFNQNLSILDMLALEPKMRGQTLASLIFTSAYQVSINKGIPACFSLIHPDLLMLFQRLGFRSYGSPFRINELKKRVPVVLCTLDYHYLLEVMSPFAMGLNHELDDNGTCAFVMKKSLVNFNEKAKPIPYDIHTFWALFADTHARIHHKRPNLFDNRTQKEVSLILKNTKSHSFKAGELITLEDQNKKTIFGVITQGTIGCGIATQDRHHWFDIFKEGDTFVLLKHSYDTGSELVAIENTIIAIIPQDLIQKIKSKDPVLAARLSMNMLAIIQQYISEVEEGIINPDTKIVAVDI